MFPIVTMMWFRVFLLLRVLAVLGPLTKMIQFMLADMAKFVCL